jgi:hypothetical protein
MNLPGWICCLDCETNGTKLV